MFEGLIGISSCVIAIIFLFMLTYKHKVIQVFSPPLLLLFLVTLGCLLRSIYFLDSPPNYYLYGLVALLIAVSFFAVGYLWPRLAYISPQVVRKVFLRRSRLIYLFSIIGAIFLLALYMQNVSVLGARFFLTEDGARTSYSFLGWGADILLVAFLLRVALKGSQGVGIVHWLLFLAAIAGAALLSARLSVLLYIFAALMVRSLVSGKKLPIKSLIVVSVIIIGGLGMLRDTAQGIDNSSVVETTYDHVMTRPYLLAIDKLGLIVGKVSENQLYLYGDSFVNILIMPIPRVLWQDKPAMESRLFVSREIYGKQGSMSGTPPGFIGELFINFSWLGVALGMFFIGFISRIAWNSWKKSNNDPLFAVLYTIFFISLFSLFGVDLQGGVMFFLKLFIPLVIFGQYYIRPAGVRFFSRAV